METFAVCGKVNGGGGADDAPPRVARGGIAARIFLCYKNHYYYHSASNWALPAKNCIKKKKSEPIPNWD